MAEDLNYWAVLVWQNGQCEMELEMYVPDPTLEFASCVTPDRPFNLSGTQCPHLQNGEYNTIYLLGLGGGVPYKC